MGRFYNIPSYIFKPTLSMFDIIAIAIAVEHIFDYSIIAGMAFVFSAIIVSGIMQSNVFKWVTHKKE
jgi:hypothetical protein